ncbi:MAG TPA: aspartate aminotransferase family protein, partial [Dehalococcoidia bacterium]|nr:aspartate aminotransferase family protein [Dehalococcoidia bacterium]
MASIAEREAAVFLKTGARVPLTLVRGEGTRVWDDSGKEYLDFVAGISTDALGHAHPAMLKAINEQAQQLIHVSNIFYTVPQVDLAELIVRESGMAGVFFCNSGAEANEGAIKLARKWGRDHRNGAFEIITAENAFHGRTLTTVTATGNPKYMDPFGPLPPGFVYVPYNDIDALRGAINEKTCAIMLEPVQGEGGVNVPDPEYLPAVRKLCDDENILLMLDEIQTGMGRTGTMFGFQRYDFTPDIMTLAKGLGGGIPVAVIVANEKASVFEPGDHGTTFGGQPFATAVALAVAQTLVDEGIPQQAAEKGDHLQRRLRALEDTHPEVEGVRGQGLLVAVAFKNDIAAEVAAAARDLGLLCNNVRPN